MICEAEVVGLRVTRTERLTFLEEAAVRGTGPSYEKTSTSPSRSLVDRRAMAKVVQVGDLSGSMVEASSRESWASPLDCAKFPRPYLGGAEAADESLGYPPAISRRASG